MYSVYACLFLAGTLYAIILNWKPINERYTPDWTWLTVVGGNGLILAALYTLCAIGELPYEAFYHALAANIAAGIPIIVWQVGQAVNRRRRRSERLGK